MKTIKIKFWQYGIVVTLIISVILGYNLFKGDKSLFLAGEATHGHHQIELECSACHTESFADQDVVQEACVGCHQDELESINDTHPKKKFLDPRNVNLLEKIEARYCVTCHTEHKPELSNSMGVTVPEDFCVHCHSEIADDRPSHAEFAFDSCSDAGCHNYHDNSMLYESFLIRHMNEPALKDKHRQPARTALIRWLKKNPEVVPLTENDHNGDSLLGAYDDSSLGANGTVVAQWSQSTHAQVGANCLDCHQENTTLVTPAQQLERCGSCHEKQNEQFKLGKHGMRATLGLPTISTDEARAPMNSDSERQLSCSSCHNPHKPDLQQSAVDACLDCHKDQHSIAYLTSPHHQLWLKEQADILPEGSGVTCASCHLPRIKKGRRVEVMHNQNHNLRPNTKMLKKVCMNCHGLEFSINALADEDLVKNNFDKAPDHHHKTFELIQKRIEKRRQRRE